MLTSGVSTFANFAYSVEFAQKFVVYDEYSFPPLLYELAFGGILPIASFLFARILAETIDNENERDETLVAAQKAERQAKKELARVQYEMEQLRSQFAKEKDELAEYAGLFATEKRERILTAKKLWPAIPHTGIATIASTSTGYVSDVLSQNRNGHESTTTTQN